MGANTGSQTPDEKLVQIIQKLQKDIEQLKTNQLRVFVVPKVSSDPAPLIEGQMWENTTTSVLKIYINSVVRTVTVT